MIVREPLPAPALQKAIKILQQMAHPLRLQILEFLDTYGTKPVMAIRKKIDIEASLVSQALKPLRDNKLVTAKRYGSYVFYYIDNKMVTNLLFTLRKVFGHITNDFRYIVDEEFKMILPKDYTSMAAKQLKIIAQFEKMRILEFLLINGQSNVSSIMEMLETPQAQTSQYLKQLREEGMLICTQDGRYVYYKLTEGIHKSIIQSLHKLYYNLENKEEF